jgi:hypothetical protein
MDTDPTIRIRPGPAPVSRGAARPVMLAAVAVVAAGSGLGAAWLFLRSSPPAGQAALPAAPVQSPVAERPAGPPSPAEPLPAQSLLQAAMPRPAAPMLDAATPLRTMREILGHRAEHPTLLRLAENPRVFVGDFPTLAAQAAALNRVAALIEKANAPRDRILNDAETARLIAETGQPAEEYYLGHNYRGEDLVRFFTLLTRQGLPRRAEEARVEAWLAEIRRQVPDGEVALITVPRPDGVVDGPAREAILRHEIAHGFYFVDPLFAGYVRRSWTERFPPAAREGFRRFLAAEGYDTANADLVINETMAYLLFTPDPRFFDPSMVGLDPDAIEALRAVLRPGVPEALQPLMVPPPGVLSAGTR